LARVVKICDLFIRYGGILGAVIKGLKARAVADDSASTAYPALWVQHGLSLFLELDLGESGRMKVLRDKGTSSDRRCIIRDRRNEV
jgi:hypothetical protein